MSRKKKISLAFIALLCAGLLWVWHVQPERVDMANYAPADTLIFIEANSLRDILQSYVKSDAWKNLGPAAGLSNGLGGSDWMTRFAGLTGIGSGEAVIFARAQVALCLFGFEAQESDEATLKIVPRGALILETHTSEWRVRAAVERGLGDFAEKTLGATSLHRTSEGETTLYAWIGQEDGRRRLIAAVQGSLVVIGNDDSSVRACLATKMGARPSLAKDPELSVMRARMDAESALVFGYAVAGSAAKVAEATAPLYVGQATEDARVQSLLFDLVPKLAEKTIGSAAWSSRFENGAFTDKYLVRLPSSLTTRLSNSVISKVSNESVAEFLPTEVSRLTFYNYFEPDKAWLALHAGLSTQVNAPHAPLITLALEALLSSYGISTPIDFLRLTKPALATVRLNIAGERKLLLVGVKDAEAMRAFLFRQFNGEVKSEQVGAFEFLILPGEEPLGASLINGHLALGSEEDVKVFLTVLASNGALASSESFSEARRMLSETPPHVTTFASDTISASAFIRYFARRRAAQNFNREAFDKALSRLPFSVAETSVTTEGWERRTRSSFGMAGSLFMRFIVREGDEDTHEKSAN